MAHHRSWVNRAFQFLEPHHKDTRIMPFSPNFAESRDCKKRRTLADMSSQDHNACISDRDILSALRNVFGDRNVINHSEYYALENSFTVLVDNRNAAYRIVDLLDQEIIGLIVF